MKNLIYFLLITAMTVTIGCSSGSEKKPFVFGKGKYKFVMTDSIGNKILDGNLTVKDYLVNDISGIYDIVNVYQKDFIALGVMDGTFDGNVIQDSNTVFINTNPRIADANVFWNMKIRSSSVSGEWRYSVFRGSVNKGKVKITK
ncbi:MAG TPA: hypothetical protein PKA90_08355 [Ignavibacteria bacterium]|nr:hypothetical protein [Ignavibacteria bacterium]HMR40430.1 hypothetical protein [Ignavibacteria bacterium]